MLFKDIPGRREIKERLIRSVLVNRISHAQLFIGAEGSMKLPLAVAYSRFIGCTEKIISDKDISNSDACGECPSCLKFNNLAHPDLHFTFPVVRSDKFPKPLSLHYLPLWRSLWAEKRGVFSILDWYNAMETENKQPIINVEDCNQIIKTLSYKSYESEYKIMIIWMAEKLFHAAAPRILKILEEPPDKTLFILITQDPSQILNTILSRTQIIRFPRMNNKTIADGLIARGFDAERAERAALFADGNMVKAIEIAGDPESSMIFLQTFKQWLRYCLKPQNDINEFVNHSEMIAGIGREKQKQFLQYGLNLFRLCYISGEDVEKIDSKNEESLFIDKLKPFVNRNNISEFNELMNTAIYHIERNANPKILFLDISLKMAKLLKRTA